MAPNRIVAVTVAILSLVLAILPTLASFDWTSTAGVIAGIAAVLGLTVKWLDGWQADEERNALPRTLLSITPPEPDKGDAGPPKVKAA